MVLLALLGIAVLAVGGGCVCVVWAERGGPRWARGVATVTLAAGELLRQNRRRSLNRPASGDDGD
ncbi:hypothetical protein [Streptomyces odontomachi]|uniref:hypothetical protein n=1 Tax=Streptomyces odontomachi TaxID=2944940 RepID=UPI00210E30AB|nr:hypothetical protein [Streptomyces sp. ODS25]